MTTVVQATVMVHARIVGPMHQCAAAIQTLSDYGWHALRNGPRLIDDVRADVTRYEIHAERVLMQGEDASAVLAQIEKELT